MYNFNYIQCKTLGKSINIVILYINDFFLSNNTTSFIIFTCIEMKDFLVFLKIFIFFFSNIAFGDNFVSLLTDEYSLRSNIILYIIVG